MKSKAPRARPRVRPVVTSLWRQLGVLTLTLVLQAASLCAFASPASAETIYDLIAEVARVHPDVRSAEKLLSAAEQDRRAAISAFYPQVSVNAELSHEKRERDTGTTSFDSPSVELKITQPLFDAGKRGYQVDATNSLISLADYEIDARQIRVGLDAAGVYLDVMRTGELDALADANLNKLVNIEAQVRSRANLDSGRTADLTYASKQVLGARIQAIMAHESHLLAIAIFKVLVGREPGALDAVNLSKLGLPSSADAALNTAQFSHPSVKATSAQVDKEMSLLRQAEAEFAPSLDLELKSTVGQNVGGTLGMTNDFYVGLKLGFSFDTGGGQFARMGASRERIGAAIADEGNAHMDLDRQVLNAWSKWVTTRQILPIQNSQTQDALDNLSNFESELAAGTRDLSEAFSVQGELFAARQSGVSAKYDNLTAAFGLAAAMGTLLYLDGKL